MLGGHFDCAHAVGLSAEWVFVSLFIWLFIWHGGNPSPKKLFPEESLLDGSGVCWPRIERWRKSVGSQADLQ
jgi:hypothetical protein